MRAVSGATITGSAAEKAQLVIVIASRYKPGLVPRFRPFEWFRRKRDYGSLFIRLLIGSFIIWGVQDNILSGERMAEFEKFLAHMAPLTQVSPLVFRCTRN